MCRYDDDERISRLPVRAGGHLPLINSYVSGRRSSIPACDKIAHERRKIQHLKQTEGRSSVREGASNVGGAPSA